MCAVAFFAAAGCGHAHAARNDTPPGAGQTEVDTKGKPIWWRGALNTNGDIDWYRFELAESGLLNLAFQKPAGKEFFCSLYGGDGTGAPIATVPAGEIGETFGGYTPVTLEKGTYFLKIWGASGHYCADKDEKYQYVLTMAKKGGSGGGQQQPQREGHTPQPSQEQQTPQPSQERQTPQPAGELTEDQAKALIESLSREERDPTHLLREEGPPPKVDVERDW